MRWHAVACCGMRCRQRLPEGSVREVVSLYNFVLFQDQIHSEVLYHISFCLGLALNVTSPQPRSRRCLRSGSDHRC